MNSEDNDTPINIEPDPLYSDFYNKIKQQNMNILNKQLNYNIENYHKKILIVDDEPFNIVALEHIIKICGVDED